jgi:alpha-tubulin suppressor-like RCC1 family protein
MSCLLSTAFPIGAWSQAAPGQGTLRVVGQPGSGVGSGDFSSELGARFRWESTAKTLDVEILSPEGDSWRVGIGTAFEETSVANYTRATRYPFQATTVPGLNVDGDGSGCNRSTGSFQIYVLERDVLSREVVRFAATFDQSCLNHPPIHGELTLGGARVPDPRPTLEERPLYPNPNAVPAFLNLRSDYGESIGRGLNHSLSAERLDAFNWEHLPNPYYGVVVNVAAADGQSSWDLMFAAPGGKQIVPGKYESSVSGQNNPGSKVLVSSTGRACGDSTGAFEVFVADYADDGTLKRFDAYIEQRCSDDAAALRGEIRLGIPGEPAVQASYALVPAHHTAATQNYDGVGNNYFMSSDSGDLIDWSVEENRLQLIFDDPDGPDVSVSMISGGERFAPGPYNLATSSHERGKPFLRTSYGGDSCYQSKGFFDVLVADYRPDGTAERFEATYENYCSGSVRATGHVRLGIATPLEPLPELAVTPTYLVIKSEPGDPVGSGGKYSLAGERGDTIAWGGTQSLANLLPIHFNAGRSNRWNLTFRTPDRAEVGNYTNLNSKITSQDAGLEISGGRACEEQTGSFRILEAVYGRSGSLTRFHAVFDHKCIESTEGLTGEVKLGVPGALEVFPPGSIPTNPVGGPLRLWGSGEFGALGNGRLVDSSLPLAPSGLLVAAKASAGFFHSLAVTREKTVQGWGYNAYGQTGIVGPAQVNRPETIPNLTDVDNVSAGLYHSVAVKEDGSAYSWGWNGFGVVGDGTTTDRTTPTGAKGLPPVHEVSSGALHSVALARDRTVWTWGWNGLGQLGDGTRTARATPVRVPGLPANIVDVSAGWYHNLALSDGGTLYAWGWNALGQVGDGSTTDRLKPIAIAGNVTSISAGYVHSVSVRNSRAMAWGWNGLGQLGDGTTVNRSRPVELCVPDCDYDGYKGVAKVAAGGMHSVAKTSSGKVFTWGWNAFGQLGDGTKADRPIPKLVMPELTVADVSAGYVHSLLVSR